MNIKIAQIFFNNPVFLIKRLKSFYTLEKTNDSIILTLYDFATQKKQQQIQLKYLSARLFQITADGKNLFFIYQANEKIILIKKQIDNDAEKVVWENDIEDYVISQTGKFAAIKIKQQGFILINTETNILLKNLCFSSKIQFLPHEDYCFAGYSNRLSRIDLISNQIKDFDIPNLEHFAVDNSGKLVVLWWNSYLQNQFAIRHIETGLRFLRTTRLEPIVYAEFISATRLLLITKKNPIVYGMLNANHQMTYKLTVYDLDNYKNIHTVTLDKISEIAIDDSGNEIAVSTDNLIKIINVPQPNTLRQYFAISNHKEKNLF